MLFATFDWNQLLIAAAIGAAIGAVVWVARRVAGTNSGNR